MKETRRPIEGYSTITYGAFVFVDTWPNSSGGSNHFYSKHSSFELNCHLNQAIRLEIRCIFIHCRQQLLMAMVDQLNQFLEHPLGGMVFQLPRTTQITKGTVEEWVTNMARRAVNVEFVGIHGLKIRGITKLREADTQRVQLHSGTNLGRLFLLPSR